MLTKMMMATLFVAFAAADKALDDNASCHWYGFECSSNDDCCTDGTTPSCCDDGFCQGGSVCNAASNEVEDKKCQGFRKWCYNDDDCCDDMICLGVCDNADAALEQQ